MATSIIILAAGQGTRMRSRLPKVLHRLAGYTLLEHVHAAAATLTAREIAVVYGYGGRLVPESLAEMPVRWVEQSEQLGTGHAVSLALEAVPDTDQVLITYGDIPLVSSASLQHLLDAAATGAFGLMTVNLSEPYGYGRIVRDEANRVIRIVEERDASPDEKLITEINTGMLTARAGDLKRWLARVDNRNSQHEYYLTDVIAMAVSEGMEIVTTGPSSIDEIRGVNDRIQLAELESIYRESKSRELMRQGVTLIDPARFDLRGSLVTGSDVTIDINVIIEGRVVLGDNVMIGPNCRLRNTEVGEGVVIADNCVIEDAVIGRQCRIGPFARIRPLTRLGDDVHIGNFVEIKNSDVGEATKINHLSYVGDSQVGRHVNIGAGTITCNYDGANKHRTVIGDNVFIGSDSQLIAPLMIGDGATLGAGTTVTRDVAPGSLIHNEVHHRTVVDWERPVRKK